ncbi:MAG: tetratricopeptide repeat protein, partial [Bacteroidales bacterium]|nr:tetratricopeptide repeat protein [Bacteroidales bacterium]
MKCRTFACLFLSLLPIFLYAETEIKLPDTLEKRLGKVRHDTVRVNILNEAAHVYLMNNPDLGRRAAQLALEIASKNNYTLGQHEAMLLLGDYYFYTGNYTEARNCYLQCLDFS